MSDPSSYYDKIPLWDAINPKVSFEIIADAINGRIPVTRLEDWREFSTLLEHEFFNRPEVQLVFRGHRRHDWSMMPTLARVTQNGIVTEALAMQQLRLFRKAIRGRIDDHSLLDDGPEDDELWSIGQHHGLMTPLLDWTYSPYVALFFAFAKEDKVDEKENPYRAVYVLNKSFVENDSLCPDIRVFEPKKDDHGRLVSQAGLFTFSPYDSTIENKLTEVLTSEEFDDDELKNAAEDEQAAILAKYICKIYIKNEQQQECLKHLRRMNVHHASLFPDLLGAADYCNVFTSEIERDKALKKPVAPDAVIVETAVPVVEAVVAEPAQIDSIKALLLSTPESKEVEPSRIELIASELSNHLSKAMVVDWQERESIKSQITNITRVILRKFGYPVNAREVVVSQILDVMAKQ